MDNDEIEQPVAMATEESSPQPPERTENEREKEVPSGEQASRAPRVTKKGKIDQRASKERTPGQQKALERMQAARKLKQQDPSYEGAAVRKKKALETKTSYDQKTQDYNTALLFDMVRKEKELRKDWKWEKLLEQKLEKHFDRFSGQLLNFLDAYERDVEEEEPSVEEKKPVEKEVKEKKKDDKKDAEVKSASQEKDPSHPPKVKRRRIVLERSNPFAKHYGLQRK